MEFSARCRSTLFSPQLPLLPCLLPTMLKLVAVVAAQAALPAPVVFAPFQWPPHQQLLLQLSPMPLLNQPPLLLQLQLLPQ